MKRFPQIAGPAAGLFFPFFAFATSFGPISVEDQARGTQYYVRARVATPGEPRMAPHVNQPYTYWRVQILEQPAGEIPASEIEVREPGGEIGDRGYHVAGTANFSQGEDVFLALKDTDEAGDVKEVVGLASGKFRVEAGKDGKQIVVSGLGLPVTGSGGAMLTPAEFSSLLRRIRQGEATEADKQVYVNRYVSHGPEDAAHAEATPAPRNERRPADIVTAPRPDSAPRQVAPNPPSPKENSVQESPPMADEGSTGNSSRGWWIGLAIVAGLLFGLFLALRR